MIENEESLAISVGLAAASRIVCSAGRQQPAKDACLHTVVVRGDRIEALGKTGKLAVPQNTQVVNATGKFLIPGLWDMHIHPHEKDTKEYLSLFIANGVTGMRVMWGFPEHHMWREEILAGELLGPRMIISRNPTPYNEDEGRQAVRKIKSDGADFLKVGVQDIPHDVYFAMADEANKLGIPFTGHMPYHVRLAEASDAGLHTLEHAVFVLFATSSESEEEIRKKAEKSKEIPMGREERLYAKYKFVADLPYSEKKAAELFARLVKNGTWVCPTLLPRAKGGGPDDPRLKYVPIFVRDWQRKFYREHMTNREIWDVRQKFFEKNLAVVGAMNNAGVGLLAGTDMYLPGLELQDELELLVQAGLSPMEALQAATYNAVKCLGLLDSMGTVERGKVADLILLDSNPLQDISNTRKIAAVVVGGKFFDKPALQEIFAQAEALEALHRAAVDGEIEQVKLLISEGADVNAKNSAGWTPLQYAASRGHREIVELLLAHDADVDIGGEDNMTAAEYAMQNNHTEILQLLISKGADISPLHFAIHMKDEAEVRSLIEGGVDVNKLTPGGLKTIRRAVFTGFTKAVELLIAIGADVNDRSNWNWTLLHGAAENGHKEIVELLINEGAAVNVRDGSGRTPLYYAQKEGHTDIVELLRKHGAKE
ncbi:MAG: ankyrin repeat domain-containing protein [Planctomycetota bacterium]